MTSSASLRIIHVERFLPVVTSSAQITLGHLAHADLRCSFGHLENMVMTSRTLQAFSLDMQLMAEDHPMRALRREDKIAAAHLLANGANRKSSSE